MARLRSYVHVPVGMDWVVYGPDDEVPAEHAALITNPKAWAEAPVEESAEESDEAPPRAGAGSGREAWVKFAESRGVHVEDEDKRDDIIQALAEAGVIDE
jgi:hypothetical protein